MKPKTLKLYVVLVISALSIALPLRVLGNSPNLYRDGNNTENIRQDRENWYAQQNSQEEFNAYAESKYGYCDAEMLATYWGQPIAEAKARIGRKVLWGDGGIPYLEQYLVDARVQALQQNESTCHFFEAGYTYNDAVALAKFWGEPSPTDAKLRVERNLILGNIDVVRGALQQVRR